MRDYQQLTRELMIFGCHVHVGISDHSAAIRHEPCPVFRYLALAASSPTVGTDTGYASYRTEI